MHEILWNIVCLFFFYFYKINLIFKWAFHVIAWHHLIIINKRQTMPASSTIVLIDPLSNSPGHWLRFELLRKPTHLHLHPITFLPCPRSHTRGKVRHPHRHVEPRLYTCRTTDRLPALSWRGRRGPTGLHIRGSGHAGQARVRKLQEDEKLHQLAGHTSLLFSSQRWRQTCSDRGKIQEGQV